MTIHLVSNLLDVCVFNEWFLHVHTYNIHINYHLPWYHPWLYHIWPFTGIPFLGSRSLTCTKSLNFSKRFTWKTSKHNDLSKKHVFVMTLTHHFAWKCLAHHLYMYIYIERFFSKRIQSYIYITQSWKTSSVSLKKRDLLIFLHPQKQKTPGQLGKVHWPTSPKDSKATLAASTSMLFGKGWRPSNKVKAMATPQGGGKKCKLGS